jgi:hypothetical protein
VGSVSAGGFNIFEALLIKSFYMPVLVCVKGGDPELSFYFISDLILYCTVHNRPTAGLVVVMSLKL